MIEHRRYEGAILLLLPATIRSHWLVLTLLMIIVAHRATYFKKREIFKELCMKSISLMLIRRRHESISSLIYFVIT